MNVQVGDSFTIPVYGVNENGDEGVIDQNVLLLGTFVTSSLASTASSEFQAEPESSRSRSTSAAARQEQLEWLWCINYVDAPVLDRATRCHGLVPYPLRDLMLPCCLSTKFVLHLHVMDVADPGEAQLAAGGRAPTSTVTPSQRLLMVPSYYSNWRNPGPPGPDQLTPTVFMNDLVFNRAMASNKALHTGNPEFMFRNIARDSH